MKSAKVKLDLRVEVPGWLWNEFELLAKRRRKKAKALVEQAARDYIQRVADEDLDAASCRAGRRSGLREQDAVEIVKEFRRRMALEVKNGRARTPATGRS